MAERFPEAPGVEEPGVLLFSGHSPAELRDRVSRAAESLADGKCVHGDSLGAGYGTFRLAVLPSAGGAAPAETLAAAARLAGAEGMGRARLPPGVFVGGGPGGAAAGAGKVALLFPGFASPYPGMLADLAPRDPYLREWLEALFGAGAAALSGAWGTGGREQAGFACSMALHRLLEGARVRCHAMAGSSNGENAALIAAGVFRLDDRPRHLSLIHRHARAEAEADRAHGAARGVAVAVMTGDAPGVAAALAEGGDGVFVALDNCPHQVVLVCTPGAAEARVLPALRARGTAFVVLPLDRPYHTPLFAAHARRLREIYEDVPVGRARVPVYSCLTAAPFPDDAAAVREQAALQWTRTVRFRAMVARMHDDGVRTFVEVGPAGKLTGFVRDTLRGHPHHAVAANLEGRPALEQLHRALADLFVLGVDVDPAGMAALLDPPGAVAAPLDPPGRAAAPPRPPARVEEPRAPADGGAATLRAHFAAMDDFLAQQERVTAALFAGLGGRGTVRLARPGATAAERGGDEEAALEVTLDGARDAVLRDHALGRRDPAPGDAGCAGLPVLPFTFGMELLARGAARLAGPGMRVTGMRAVRAVRWLAADRGTLSLRIVARRRGGSAASVAEVEVELFDREGGAWARTPAFHGRVLLAAAHPAPPAPRAAAAGEPGRCPAERYYRDWLFHGPTLRSVAAVPAVSPGGLLAELAAPAAGAPADEGAPREEHLSAALLDSAGQLVGYWLLERGHRDFGSFPFALDAADFHAPLLAPASRLQARAEVRDEGATVTADVDYVGADGAVAVRLRGFRQKHFSFPPGFLHGLLRPGAGTPATDAVPTPPGVTLRLLRLRDPAVLEEAGGIWARALAHVWLAPAEREAWYALPSGPGRGEWLLGRVAAKDALRARAGARGEAVPAPHEVTIVDGPDGGARVAPSTAEAPPVLSIDRGRGYAAAALGPAGSRVGVALEILPSASPGTRPSPATLRRAREAAGGIHTPVHALAHPGCVLALAHRSPGGAPAAPSLATFAQESR